MGYRFKVLTVFSIGILSGCAGLDHSGQLHGVPSSRHQILPADQVTPIEKDPVYQLMVAELAVNRGMTNLAVENYLALALSQEDAKIAERAVRIAVFGQDMNAAQLAAKRWLELEPERIEAQQIIASIYIRQGNADQAFYYLDSIIKAQEEITDNTFISLLGVLSREKNIDTVLKVSKRIADNHSGYAYAHFLHGSLASRTDKTQESLEYLDNALAVKDIPDAHAIRANTLIKLGKREEAVISLKRAVLSKPKNRQLRLAYARLLVDVKEYERARIEFEKLHMMAPNDSDLLYTLGLLSLEAERFDAAEKYLSKLLSLGKRKGEAQYYLGRINESRNQYQKAIKWYHSVSTGEYRFDAKLRAASLVAKVGNTDEAIEQLEKMAGGSQAKASLVRIYLAMGDVFNNAEQYQDAINIYDKALLVIPGNIDLLYARGLTGEKLGNISLLEQDMQAILNTEPDNAHALNALGFTLADRTDRLQEAYQYLQRAIQIKPEDPAIIDSFGWVNYRLGNYEEAIRFLKKALTRMEDGEIAAHLGEVLWVTGKQQEAIEIWEKALESLPDNPYVIKTMKRFTQQ